MHRAMTTVPLFGFSHAVIKQYPSYCTQTALDRLLANAGLTPKQQIRRATTAARRGAGTGVQGEAAAIHAAAAAGGGDF